MGHQASSNRTKDSGVCRDSMYVHPVIRSIETSREAFEPGIIATVSITIDCKLLTPALEQHYLPALSLTGSVFLHRDYSLIPAGTIRLFTIGLREHILSLETNAFCRGVP